MHLRWLSAVVPNSLAPAGHWTAVYPISTYVIGSQQTFFIISLPPEERLRQFLTHSYKCWEAGGSEASSVFGPEFQPPPRSTFDVRVTCSQRPVPICYPDKATIQQRASRLAAKIPEQGQPCWKRDKKSEDPTCFLTPASSVFRTQEPSATLDETL